MCQARCTPELLLLLLAQARVKPLLDGHGGAPPQAPVHQRKATSAYLVLDVQLLDGYLKPRAVHASAMWATSEVGCLRWAMCTAGVKNEGACTLSPLYAADAFSRSVCGEVPMKRHTLLAMRRKSWLGLPPYLLHTRLFSALRATSCFLRLSRSCC